MTTSVPDSFNMDQLNAALNTAPQEEDLHKECTCDHSDNSFPEEINDVAIDILSQAAERIKDPVIFKAIIIHAASNMISWHSDIAEKAIEAEDLDMTMAWARDAGKFQAINNILLSISLGSNDVFYKD